MKNVFQLLKLCKQVADLPLDPFICIDFNAVNESGLGALNCVLYIGT